MDTRYLLLTAAGMWGTEGCIVTSAKKWWRGERSRDGILLDPNPKGSKKEIFLYELADIFVLDLRRYNFQPWK